MAMKRQTISQNDFAFQQDCPVVQEDGSYDIPRVSRRKFYA